MSDESLLCSTYHYARRSRKNVDWDLKVTNECLILGDANVHTFPSIVRPDFQIDCYPEVKFYHFIKLMEKTPTNEAVRLVLLSLGLDNRAQDPKKTSIKQLRALYRTTVQTFPNADVLFSLINHSPLLEPQERSNLEAINAHVRENFHFLPLLPQEQFRTEEDNIHWTADTAECMLRWWFENLAACNFITGI